MVARRGSSEGREGSGREREEREGDGRHVLLVSGSDVHAELPARLSLVYVSRLVGWR